MAFTQSERKHDMKVSDGNIGVDGSVDTVGVLFKSVSVHLRAETEPGLSYQRDSSVYVGAMGEAERKYHLGSVSRFVRPT
jgi:hypothetical protein